MSSKKKPVIVFKEVSKVYEAKVLTQAKGFRDKITRKSKIATKASIKALDTISFQIDRGEKIGIIGSNGSGKSTLLKILCKITPPTSGEILVGEKIIAMLDVGTGFHPELTGYENIMFRGSILGLKRKFVEEQIAQIIQFSALDAFIHIPLKKYSMGMKMRLATSMAFFLDSKILVFDEILNTADFDFKAKCLIKIEQLSKHSETTAILVSHNLQTIRSFSNRIIWMKQGRLHMEGLPEKVIHAYIQDIEKEH